MAKKKTTKKKISAKKAVKKAVKKTTKAKLAKKVAKPVKKAAAKPVKKAAKKVAAKPKVAKKALKKVEKKGVKKVAEKALKKAKDLLKSGKKEVKGKLEEKLKITVEETLVEEEVEYSEEGFEPEADEFEEEVLLTDAEGNVICRVPECDQVSQVDGYCRYHYLLFWKKIQARKKILSEGKLERYIEELTARYPDKFLEVLKKDLKSQKEFLAAIHELEIDEASEDTDFEEDTNFIDEIRGVSDSGASSRDDEDY